jgi:hypothetical protein
MIAASTIEVPAVSRSRRTKPRGGGALAAVRDLAATVEAIAQQHLPPAQAAGGHFNHGAAAGCDCHPPRPQVADDFHRVALPIDEHDVDREAHARGVNGGAGRQQHRRRVVEVIAAEQAAAPRPARRRDFHGRRHRLVGAFVEQCDMHQNTPGTRCQPTRWQYCR